jgi:hypothetical protein
MKRLLYIFFFCGITIDIFAQGCYPTISLVSSSISESPPTFPTNRVGLDYEKDYFLIGGATNTITIAIANADGCTQWQVSVYRADNPNFAGLSYSVNKWSDGTSLSPGSSIDPIGVSPFLNIETYSQRFFSGVKNRELIKINYKISGISVKTNATQYNTTIYFTVSGI